MSISRPIICLCWIAVHSTTPSFAKGLDDLSNANPEAADDSSHTQDSNAAPSKAVKSDTVGSPPSSNTSQTPNPVTTPPQPPAAQDATSSGSQSETSSTIAPKPMERSATSLRLNDRLAIGTTMGWRIVKPAEGEWIGIGGSDLNLSWKFSSNTDSRLFLTTRYTPVTGVWKYEDRYYNTTLHGLFVGSDLVLPVRLGSSNLRFGGEVGYLLVYTTAQDEAEIDSETRTNRFAYGLTSDWTWQIMEKVWAGPSIRLTAGAFATTSIGAGMRFVF
jgi:hypothetical protein